MIYNVDLLIYFKKWAEIYVDKGGIWKEAEKQLKYLYKVH